MSTATVAPEVRTQEAPKPRHEANGRFAPANSGGVGNPYARQVAHYRKIVMECASDQDLRDIVNKFIALAKEGNAAAARFIMPYLCGKPVVPADPDNLDLAEWKTLKDTHTMVNDAPNLMGSPAPEMPLKWIRASREVFNDIRSRQFVDAMRNPDKYELKAPDLKIVPDRPSPDGSIRPGSPSADGSIPPSDNEHLSRMRVAEPSKNGKK
jgi:hypothetical protein